MKSGKQGLEKGLSFIALQFALNLLKFRYIQNWSFQNWSSGAEPSLLSTHLMSVVMDCLL